MAANLGGQERLAAAVWIEEVGLVPLWLAVGLVIELVVLGAEDEGAGPVMASTDETAVDEGDDDVEMGLVLGLVFGGACDVVAAFGVVLCWL